MEDCNIEYHRDVSRRNESYFYNETHFKNGNIIYKQYYFEGKLHRVGGPAIIDYYLNGGIHIERYYKHARYHRDGFPAVIYYYDRQSTPGGYSRIQYEDYYIDGLLHREDGPAVICYYPNGKIKTERYYLNEVEYDDKDITDNWKAFCKMQIFR